MTEPVTRVPEIVEALREEHRSIMGMIDRFESVGAEDRSEWFDQLRQVLVRHEAAEEQTVYPSVRGDAASQGRSSSGDRARATHDEVLDVRLAEQAEVHDLIARLETVNTGTDRFLREFSRLRGTVLDHVQQEERSIIRFIEQDKSPEERREMGRHYDRAKHGARGSPASATHAAVRSGSRGG